MDLLNSKILFNICTDPGMPTLSRHLLRTPAPGSSTNSVGDFGLLLPSSSRSIGQQAKQSDSASQQSSIRRSAQLQNDDVARAHPPGGSLAASASTRTMRLLQTTRTRALEHATAEVPCYEFTAGTCGRGSQCKYSHEAPAPNDKKPCYDFAAGAYRHRSHYKQKIRGRATSLRREHATAEASASTRTRRLPQTTRSRVTILRPEAYRHRSHHKFSYDAPSPDEKRIQSRQPVKQSDSAT
jgi:hypothetical protein